LKTEFDFLEHFYLSRASMVGLDKDDEQQMLFHLNKIIHQADGIFLSQSLDGGIFGFFYTFWMI